MRFEWDGRKASLNERKHGVSFDLASLVFGDLNRTEEIDDVISYDEERLITTGAAAGKLLTVTYTLRAETIRIISARKATKHEQQNYHIQIGT